jgi:tetratricopeptide (TPR) repeat protein
MSGPPGSKPTQTIDIAQTIDRARAAWRAGQTDDAEMACRQILSVWPGHPEASHLMGLMAYDFGNLDLAIGYLRQACQSPRAPAIYFSDFGEMCRQGGLLAEGEQAARRAVALQPNLAAAWNNLGIILQEALKLDESRSSLERALALEPSDPQTINNLANTFKRLGLAQEAEQRWRAALALRPDYAEVFSNLANLYNDQGEFDRAEAMARRAIELNPGLTDAYINLAGVETARHRHLEALHTLDALLALAPGHARALAAKALTLKDLDRLDEALAWANRASVVAPDAPESHNAIGQVFQAMGQYEPALAAYERGANLPGPAQMDAIANRGSLFLEFGRQDEARQSMEEAAQAFPNSPGILYGQTELRRFEADDPLIGKMSALLAREGITLSDRATLHFGLAKAMLDIGDSAQAFRHYDEGNRLKRSTFDYDPDASARWMASIGATFTAEHLESKAAGGARSDLPVFVVGMPRSGTTLVEQIIASHPMAHGAGELKRLHAIAEQTGRFPDSIADLTAAESRTLGEAYLDYIAPLAAGRPRVVDKMPSNFLYCGLIRLILPDARIVHCRRDPVDTCLSCYTKLFVGEQSFSYDQRELGRYHRAYQALMAHWRAILPASHFLEVDYEAVVEDIEGQTRRILDFLGLPFDEACLRFHETRRPVRTASVNQVRQPLYSTSVGRWRKHAPQLQPLLQALAGPAQAPS